MTENQDKNFLDYFIRQILPGLLIFALIALLLSQCEVTLVTVKQDHPMKPTKLEISGDGDTTYIYEIVLDDEDEDVDKSLSIKF